MNEILDERSVQGIAYVNQSDGSVKKFYLLDLVGLCDDKGDPIKGHGHIVTDVIPLNTDKFIDDADVDPVYDTPSFVLNAQVFYHDKKCPKTIKVLKRFTWDDALMDDTDEAVSL